ncbi:hypothetical protein CDAR_543201 [Caerostris darwini]|uniref:Uncharacterized protein n=1 Tax=Caerostris darwini TaxID=1538125 RepID=A0AAV4WXT3_9ARAC|nr:hypothetical protein CDAR_543201 [Caerostris darwini]
MTRTELQQLIAAGNVRDGNFAERSLAPKIVSVDRTMLTRMETGRRCHRADYRFMHCLRKGCENERGRANTTLRKPFKSQHIHYFLKQLLVIMAPYFAPAKMKLPSTKSFEVCSALGVDEKITRGAHFEEYH